MKALTSIALAAAALTLSSVPAAARADTPQDAFFKNLSALCGQKFEGKVVIAKMNAVCRRQSGQ